MKSFFTIVLIAITTLLSAQTDAVESLMNDNAVASADATMFFADEALTEVDDEFNLSFTAVEYFADIVISYDLNTEAEVRLEVEKAGSQAIALVNELQSTGSQKVLWDQNIEPGKYTIRLIVDNKVEIKKVNLSH